MSPCNRTSLEELQRQCPQATLEECRRFQAVRDGASKLTNYMAWREKHSLDSLQEITDDDTDSTVDSPVDSTSTVELDFHQRDGLRWEEAKQKALFANHTFDIVEAKSTDEEDSDGTPCLDLEPEQAPTKSKKKTFFSRRKHRGSPGPTGTEGMPNLKALKQTMFAPRGLDPKEIARDCAGRRCLAGAISCLHGLSRRMYGTVHRSALGSPRRGDVNCTGGRESWQKLAKPFCAGSRQLYPSCRSCVT